MADHAAKDQLISRRVFSGTVANYIGQFVTLIVGFFLTPFILHQLGESNYGLWALVSSAVAYGTLLDLGIWGTVVKYVAEYRARGSVELAHSLIATTLSLYSFLGLIAVTLSLIFAPIFPRLFNVPPADQATAMWLVVLSGIQIGLSFPCSTAAAVLRGSQRFDLVNLLTVSGVLLTAGATVLVLLLGGGVLGLVTVNLVATLIMQIPAVWLVRRIAPDLHFGFRGARRSFIRTVISFSTPVFVTQLAGRFETETDQIIIGAFLPISTVTPYAIARRLSDIPYLLTSQFVKVLLPIASELHAEEDWARLRTLYLISTRLTAAIFVVIGCPAVVLAGWFLTVWVGPEYAASSVLVAILVLAGFVDISQWPAGAVLQGAGRHHPLASMSVGAAVINVALSIVLVQRVGVAGVALGTLIATSLVTLIFVMPYVLRVIGLGVGKALKDAFLPALLPAIPMTIVLLVLQQVIQAPSWPAIILVGGAGVLVYALFYLGLGANDLERETYRNLARGTFYFARARLKRSRE